jgi:hypothetical protein
MIHPRERKRVLVTVRTYPTPAKKGIEVSCTAGVTDAQEWIRLYPVPYRRMDPDKRFDKYQWIDVDVTKAPSDPRPESFRPDIESIQITGSVPSTNRWQQRRSLLEPLISHCFCCIKGRQAEVGFPTLGLFKPAEIECLVIEPTASQWTEEELARLRQFSLFEKAPLKELEKIPFKFSYAFRCDHDDCTGHTVSSTDWEMMESYRSWRTRYGSQWESKFRHTYEYKMKELNDTYFYVGNQLAYPKTWIIVGLFYPRLGPVQGALL